MGIASKEAAKSLRTDEPWRDVRASLGPMACILVSLVILLYVSDCLCY